MATGKRSKAKPEKNKGARVRSMKATTSKKSGSGLQKMKDNPKKPAKVRKGSAEWRRRMVALHVVEAEEDGFIAGRTPGMQLLREEIDTQRNVLKRLEEAGVSKEEIADYYSRNMEAVERRILARDQTGEERVGVDLSLPEILKKIIAKCELDGHTAAAKNISEWLRQVEKGSARKRTKKRKAGVKRGAKR
jgi:hypothetical protein